MKLFSFGRSSKNKLYPVILSGGAGSRLWPLSRENYPKQLLNLCHDTLSMIQLTAKRASDQKLFHPPTIICNEEHRFIISEQLRTLDIKPQNTILEPVGKNTAPAILLAALDIHAKDKSAILLCMPADHHIRETDQFIETVKKGFDAAKTGKIVTIGITPDSPHTGYGYIQKGKAFKKDAFIVERFTEKPDEKTAKDFLKDGDHFWNSGIVIAPAELLISEIKKYNPDIFQAVEKSLQANTKDLDFTRPDAPLFANCPSLSFDYAVLEKSEHVLVVPSKMHWSDIGSWASLWESRDKDENGNAYQGEVYLEDVKNCYIQSRDKVFAGIGVEDLIIVDLKDTLFVARKDKVDQIKNIFNKLKAKGREEVINHRRVYRPWGFYEQIDEGNRFQVKLIQVKPGGTLSLQKHHHRAEHWVVVNGTARVTCGEDVFLLSENESTYIPLGTIHRLENPGKVPLNMIEVQSGTYLGEDDIVRTEDVYGRAKGSV